jgi:hypothetical protein
MVVALDGQADHLVPGWIRAWHTPPMAAHTHEIQASFVGSAVLASRGPHPWHTGPRVWSSANSQVDAWVGLLHTLGLDPVPMLASAFCADFEGDQWTLLKVQETDLWAAYGIAVRDLHIWRPLLAHLVEQLDRGHAVLVDVDAFHLPDMIASSYQREHVKVTIAVTGYDRNAHRLRYLNGGIEATADGEDLDSMLTAGIGIAQLPPVTQLVRLDRLKARSDEEYAVIGKALASLHGTRLPATNPVRRFGDAMRTHGAWLTGGDADHYQRWAFATLQQCGAAFELAGDTCDWLSRHGEPLAIAAEHFRRLSRASRELHQRLARVPQSGRMPDISASIEDMADAWDAAMTDVRPLYGA